MFAITQLIRDIEFVFGANFHELDAFCPPSDDLAEAKFGRLVAFVRRVEDGAVDKSALIVAAYGVAGYRMLAIAFDEDLILKAAAGAEHALAFGVFGEELLALLFGGLAFLGCLSLLESFHFGEKLVEDGVRLFVRQARLGARDEVADSQSEIVDVERSFKTHVHELVANIVAKSVA